MADDNNGRPIGTNPITDAASATAPDATWQAGSNADLRVGDDDDEDAHRRDAAITATGEDIDNDHADERPVDRSDDADKYQQQNAEADFPDQHQDNDEQFAPTR